LFCDLKKKEGILCGYFQKHIFRGFL